MPAISFNFRRCGENEGYIRQSAAAEKFPQAAEQSRLFDLAFPHGRHLPSGVARSAARGAISFRLASAFPSGRPLERKLGISPSSGLDHERPKTLMFPHRLVTSRSSLLLSWRLGKPTSGFRARAGLLRYPSALARVRTKMRLCVQMAEMPFC